MIPGAMGIILQQGPKTNSKKILVSKKVYFGVCFVVGCVKSKNKEAYMKKANRTTVIVNGLNITVEPKGNNSVVVIVRDNKTYKTISLEVYGTDEINEYCVEKALESYENVRGWVDG